MSYMGFFAVMSRHIYCYETPTPHVTLCAIASNRGGARNFLRGLALPTKGLKYCFKGDVNTKNLRKYSFSPYDRR